MTGPFDVGALGAFVACCLLALGLASTPLLAWADAPPDHAKRRVSTLDGLRGFLALGVVVYHGTIYRGFNQTGRWEPGSAFSLLLGQLGVALFFTITGYLFWRRLVLSGGRMDWPRLYVGRVFRIGPVFLLAALIAIAVSFQGGRHAHTPLPLLLKQIGYYLFIGVLPAVPVHGYDTNLVLAGVTWSLQYEWAFYAALPLLALLTRSGRLHVVFAAALFLLPFLSVCFGWSQGAIAWHPELVCLFGAGALTASLQQCRFVLPVDGAAASVAGSAAIVWLASRQSMADPVAIGVMAILFYLIATGCSLFGLLQTRAAHRLGHLSYGIYLLQGLALAAIMRPLHRLSAGSAEAHFLLLVGSSILLIVMALLAHCWVELPGMRLGDRVARQVATWRTSRAEPAHDRAA